MKQLVLGIASLMVIPNLALLLIVARPRPAPTVSEIAEAGIQQIVITASEYKFDLAQINLPPAGQRVRLVFINAGNVRHNFTIEDLVNSDIVLDLEQAGTVPKALREGATERAAEGIIHLPAEPGGIAAVEFTVGASGTYDAVCTLKGHEQLGMLATASVP